MNRYLFSVLHPPQPPPMVPNAHVGHHHRQPYIWAFISPYFHVRARPYVETVGRPIRASNRNRRFLRPKIVGKHTHNNRIPAVNPSTRDTMLDTSARGRHFPRLLASQRAMCSHGRSSKNGSSSIFKKIRFWKIYRVNTWHAGRPGVAGNDAHGQMYPILYHA